MRSLPAVALGLLAGLVAAAAHAAAPEITATLDGAPVTVARLTSFKPEPGDLLSGLTLIRLTDATGKPFEAIDVSVPADVARLGWRPQDGFAIVEVSLPWHLSPIIRSPRAPAGAGPAAVVERVRGSTVLWIPRTFLPCTLAFRRPVETIADQAALARIALEDADPAYRLGAVRRVTDQAVLCRLAAGEKAADLRLAAVERCNDQPLLARLTAAAEPLPIRSAAVARVADQPLLARLAVEDEVAAVRTAAAARVSEPALLARVALEAADPAVRRSVLERSTDQALLARAAAEERDPALRAVAVGRCGDQGLLARRAVEEPVPALRRQVVGRLADQAVLATVAIRDADAGVRAAAAARLTDPAAQARVVAEAEDPAVLSAVASNLRDPAALMRLAARPAARPLRGSIDRRLRSLGVPDAFEPSWVPPLALRFTTHPTSFGHRTVGATPWPTTKADLTSETLQLGWFVLGASQSRQAIEGTPGRVRDQLLLVGLSTPLTPPFQLLQLPEAHLRVGLAGPSLDLWWHFGLDQEWSFLTGALNLPRLRIARGHLALELGFGSLCYDIQLGDFEATDPYSDKVTHWRRRTGFVGSFDALLIYVP